MASTRAAVAAHHPHTLGAAAEVLAAGGSAADAAVAALLAACVTESLTVGLLSGGHALHRDAASGDVTCVDFSGVAPTAGGARRGRVEEVTLMFDRTPVRYAVGAGTFAVPGLPAGCGRLHARFGRLPWRQVVDPALLLARRGVRLRGSDAALLAALAPVRARGRGRALLTRGGRLRTTGEQLSQPGLVGLLELLAQRGPAACYRGDVAAELVAFVRQAGGTVTADDLAGYEVTEHAAARVEVAGAVVACPPAAPLRGVLGTLDRSPGLTTGGRTAALAQALAGRPLPEPPAGPPAGPPPGSSLVVRDADGNLCAVSASGGVGTGEVFYDTPLNSLLGTLALHGERPPAGARVGGGGGPAVLLTAAGPMAAAATAGGGGVPGPLARMLLSVAADGWPLGRAVERPRIHPHGGRLDVEPGLDDDEAAACAAAGFAVRRWPQRHLYFGAVTAVGVEGPWADGRREGAQSVL